MALESPGWVPRALKNKASRPHGRARQQTAQREIALGGSQVDTWSVEEAHPVPRAVPKTGLAKRADR